MRCACAVKMVRNNGDGTRTFKLKGDLHCRKCRGYGRHTVCQACFGCGLLPGSLKCIPCDATGVVPITAS